MRNRRYWDLHKENWINNFESLSPQVRERVMLDPHGYEGKRLEKVVEREAEHSFRKEIAPAEPVGA